MHGKTIITALLAATLGSSALANADPQQPDSTQTVVTSGRGRLGFTAIQISPELRRHFGAASDRGVLVDRVLADSPAARAGLLAGDLVLTVDGARAQSVEDVINAISDVKKNDVVTLDIQRGPNRMTLHATLESDPGPRIQRFERDWSSGQPGESPIDGTPFMADPETRKALEDLRMRLDRLERRFDESAKGMRSQSHT